MHTKINIRELSMFFKVFSDETRLKILGTLLDSDKCVCEIANAINISPSAVSHQLKLLRTLNLVKTNKNGQNVTYGVSDEHIKIILEYGIEHINER
ncbi:MAG: winged helix-turn-helix transcriptional regulator [Bacilli bacterium]|nr:winged helix-turn-helix transcriptional regulator [Bacilli bacterium]